MESDPNVIYGGDAINLNENSPIPSYASIGELIVTDLRKGGEKPSLVSLFDEFVDDF